jgi:hypothetical protein
MLGIERIGVAVTLDLYSRGAWFESRRTPVILTEGFPGFTQPLEEKRLVHG